MRSEVSGVRSSCPASATSRRCRSREASSAVSIWLNAVAEPGDLVVALDRQRCRGPRCGRCASTAVVRRRTGRSPLRATPQPAMPAPSTPSSRTAGTPIPSRESTRSCCSSDWAITRELVRVDRGRHGDDPVAPRRRRAIVRTLSSLSPRATSQLGRAEGSGSMRRRAAGCRRLGEEVRAGRRRRRGATAAGPTRVVAERVDRRGALRRARAASRRAALQLHARGDVGAERRRRPPQTPTAMVVSRVTRLASDRCR